MKTVAPIAKIAFREMLRRALVIVTLITLTTMNTAAQEQASPAYLSVYPGYITRKENLIPSKEFYEKWFGFQVVFESSWFVLLTSPGENGTPLALMSEDHPSAPPSNHFVTPASGVWLTLQVADAKAEYDRLKKAGMVFRYELKDEAWGQRRFGVVDPNGMYVDIVEQTEPQAGFWDKYMVK